MWDTGFIMLPKKLHYIWIGNSKTELANKCIDSFHKYMSDYEIIEWNESNINSLNLDCIYKQYYDFWYDRGLFAFCTDIARMFILEQHGGIYVDCDVEFIKHLPDSYIEKPIISRLTPKDTVNTGCIWGCEKHDPFTINLINIIRNKLETDGHNYKRTWVQNTIVLHMFNSVMTDNNTKNICQCNGYNVYPAEYFCPINMFTGENNITDKTISIHHFALSWQKYNPNWKLLVKELH